YQVKTLPGGARASMDHPRVGGCELVRDLDSNTFRPDGELEHAQVANHPINGLLNRRFRNPGSYLGPVTSTKRVLGLVGTDSLAPYPTITIRPFSPAAPPVPAAHSAATRNSDRPAAAPSPCCSFCSSAACAPGIARPVQFARCGRALATSA